MAHLLVVVVVVIGIRYHNYSFSPLWWQWRKWLGRLSLFLKNSEQESKRSVGGVCGWTRRTLLVALHRFSSCWRLDTKISFPRRMVLHQEGRFAATVSHTDGLQPKLNYSKYPQNSLFILTFFNNSIISFSFSVYFYCLLDHSQCSCNNWNDSHLLLRMWMSFVGFRPSQIHE